MISTASLPQIYFYSNLKKLLGNNLANKGKKKMSRGQAWLSSKSLQKMVEDALGVHLVMAQPQA